MRLQRITFAETAETFSAPTLGRARVSIAWWEQGNPDPVFVRGPHGGPSTVVIVWPTDSQGLLVPGQVQQGLWRALPWHLDEVAFVRLRDLHRGWPLDRHDLWVGPSGIYPRPNTLRSWPGLRAEMAVTAAISTITGDRAPDVPPACPRAGGT